MPANVITYFELIFREKTSELILSLIERLQVELMFLGYHQFFEGVTLTNISPLRKQDNPLFQIGPSDQQIVSKLRTRPNSSCLKFSKCNVSDPLI